MQNMSKKTNPPKSTLKNPLRTNPSGQIIEDSILAGVLNPFPEIVDVIPEKAPNGRVQYRVIGDVEGALNKIYQNTPIGALDVLKAIKAARQAIFSLKGQGNETNGHNSR